MSQKNKKTTITPRPQKIKEKKKRQHYCQKKQRKEKKMQRCQEQKKKKGTPRARKTTKKKKKRPMYLPKGEEKKNEGYLKKLAVCTYTSAFLSIKKKFILTCILNKYYDRNCNLYYQ